MNESFQCPFCEHYFPITNHTYSSYLSSFKFSDRKRTGYIGEHPEKEEILLKFFNCPSCNNISIAVKGKGHQFKDKVMNFHPDSLAKQYPEYIPAGVRQDYEEAHKIVNLSPKASATLSRRCLQGMIRDFWDVKDERNLFNEIKAIEEKVDPEVRTVLDSLRQIGNIGAHPEKDINLIVDIEPGEAKQLLIFIEYLMDEWYIKREKTAEMLRNINTINDKKQRQKKN